MIIYNHNIVLCPYFSGSSIDEGIFDSLFVISIGTSTGYKLDYMLWPVVTHILLFLLMIIYACAGSTSGGLKLMRVTLALKALREIGRIAQPKEYSEFV